MGILTRPGNALVVGFAIAGLALAVWFLESNRDVLGLASFLVRFIHIGAAMLWIGMIWFVNFIQLAALRDTDEAGRAAMLRHVVPQVAALFRVASHVVVASGAGLLLTTGYMLDRWVFPSAVYIPSARGAMIWGGAIVALVMWGLVHAVIWPGLKIITEPGAGPATLAKARERVMLAGRINLVLAVPVTFAMIAAAHLY